MADMMNLIKQKLQDFIPDFIFTITPAPFLQKMFPAALVLYRDAMYCREPWPDELTSFDPFGLSINNGLMSYKKELLNLPNTVESEAFVAQIDDLFLTPILQSNPLLSLFEKYRERFSKLLLLPLQSSGHYNFYSCTNFSHQFDYLTYALEQIPPHIGVVVIQHPDDLFLTQAMLEYLRATYPHFLYEDSLTSYHAPSQYALPLVDGLICVSSGLCYQALLWNKPIFIIGNSFFSIFSSNPDWKHNIDIVLEQHLPRRTGFITWLLTCYKISYAFIYDGVWLGAYLERALSHKRQSGIGFNFFEKPFASHDEIILRLSAHKRSCVLFKAGQET